MTGFDPCSFPGVTSNRPLYRLCNNHCQITKMATRKLNVWEYTQYSNEK